MEATHLSLKGMFHRGRQQTRQKHPSCPKGLMETEFGYKFKPTSNGGRVQATQHIKSISYLKSHAAQISEALEKNGTPFIITQNGEASMVVEGIKQYQDKENLIAMLKLVALGEKDRLAGQGHSVEEVRALLAQMRAQRKA